MKTLRLEKFGLDHSDVVYREGCMSNQCARDHEAYIVLITSLRLHSRGWSIDRCHPRNGELQCDQH